MADTRSDLSSSSVSVAEIGLFQIEKQPFTLNDLFESVVKGDEDKAKRILEIHPEWLLEKSSVTDYSGIERSGTVFQIALCAGDFEMCEMMEPYFAKLTDKPDALSTQFNEIPYEEAPPFDFSEITKNIANSKEAEIKLEKSNRLNGSKLSFDLFIFRKRFGECSRSEKYFNPQHLLQAFRVYEEEEDQSAIWSEDCRDLFWWRVVLYAARFLPACYAQAFSQGLFSIVGEGKALERSLNFRHGGVFYPLPEKEKSGIGFDVINDLKDSVWHGDVKGWIVNFEKLCAAKVIKREELKNRIEISVQNAAEEAAQKAKAEEEAARKAAEPQGSSCRIS